MADQEELKTYNIDIERTILGSVLFDPSVLTTLRSKITNKTFYLPNHEKIYAAMCQLQDAGKAYDEHFIIDALGEGIANDVLLCSSSNPIANMDQYVEQILEYQQKREIIKASRNIPAALQETEHIDEVINEVIKNLQDIADMNSVGYTIKRLIDLEYEKQEFILKDFLPIPKGTVSIFAAPGGTGKSWTALQIGIRYGKSNPADRALLWLSEDTESQNQNRVDGICNEVLGVNFDDISNVDIISDKDTPPTLIKNKSFSFSEFYKMRKRLRGYKLIIIDPLIAFYGGDENSNSEARIFMQPFINWAMEDGVNIIFLHHSSKDKGDGAQSRARGAGAFVDACRTVYGINKIYTNARLGELDPNKKHEREFTLIKDNLGAGLLLDGESYIREITPKKTAQALDISYENINTDEKPLF